MRRFFVKNILFILSVNILVKTIWAFFIDRAVQNRVGDTAYGSYSPLLSLSIILASFNNGVTNYNSRTISQDPDKLGSVFPVMLSTQLLFLLLYSVIVLIGWLLGYQGPELAMLAGVLMIQSLNLLLQFLRSNVAGLQKFKLDGLLSVSDRFIMIVLCGFLLYYPVTGKNFKIEWFVFAQIASYLIACIVAFILLQYLHPVALNISFDRKKIIAVMKDSFPYALVIFFMSVYIRSDMKLLELLCGSGGKQQAGIYAASYRLLDYSIQFAGMFAVMLLPFFGKMLAQKQNVQPIIQLCVNMLLPFSFMVSVAALFFGNDIMHMLHKESGSNDPYIFAWLMASFPGWCMTYIYCTLLAANGNVKVLNIITFAGAVINLSLNFYLIPRYQALGAAFTAFITQSFVAIVFIIACISRFNLPVNTKWLLAHAAFLIVAFILGYGTYLLHINWIAAIFLYGIICVLLMFLLRFVSVGAIKQLLNKQ